jgi:hypothetical protein
MRRLALLALALGAVFLPSASSATGREKPNLQGAVLKRIGNPAKLSAGAKAWLLGPGTRLGKVGPRGPQGSGGRAAGANGAAARGASVSRETQASFTAAAVAFGGNVDAANPNEDVASGQSETAIGATTTAAVLTAWNDVSGFLIADSTSLRASLTGIGYSKDGGLHFSDLIGLPNPNPQQQWFGDPAVVALDATHFAVASLYLPSLQACSAPQDVAQLTIAVSIGTVSSDGSTVTFGNPVRVSDAGNLCSLFGSNPDPNVAFLDKDAIAYDPTSRTLAVSFTRFFLGVGGQSGNGEIDVARAHLRSDPANLHPNDFNTAVVWSEEPFCTSGVVSSEAARCGAEDEGAYVSVASGGATYVAWERNWITNLFDGDPYVYIHAARIPAAASAPDRGGPANPVVVSQGQANANADGGVKSLDSTTIPGFNRSIGQDFPRIAVNGVTSKVIVEWNDGSHHPLGDIFLRALSPNLTGGVIQQVNGDSDFTLHFLPAVSVRSDGAVCSSWYDRRASGPDSALTDYEGDCGSPTGTDFRITTGVTDWTNTGSLIIPNFGDYTDNASAGTATYFTWSDGRIGIPQPFVATH